MLRWLRCLAPPVFAYSFRHVVCALVASSPRLAWAQPASVVGVALFLHDRFVRRGKNLCPSDRLMTI